MGRTTTRSSTPRSVRNGRVGSGARHAIRVALIAAMVALAHCGPRAELAPPSQTFGELRAVRGEVLVTPPGGKQRALLPRERLADGSVVQIGADSLAWLRRDAGSTLLVRGPASLTFGKKELHLVQGRLFIDSPSAEPTLIRTAQGLLALTEVRASLEVEAQGKPTSIYVLQGAVRSPKGPIARAGERMVLKTIDEAPEITPNRIWVDWTGGLATTDRQAAAVPFGIGTVGARRPGDAGIPHKPLAIRRMEVRVKVTGDLAVTEVDQIFFNGSTETVEGVYSFRTPPAASLTRFGVDRGDVVVWGRIKEKTAAAAQYASNVYQGSTEDPALLEWDSPGVYRAKLYPIEPGSTRRVVVRYSEWLARSGGNADRRLYVFPMAAEGSAESLPTVEFFGATVDLSEADAEEVRTGMNGTIVEDKVVIRSHDLVPRADLAVELFDNGVSALEAITAEHQVDELTTPQSELGSAREKAKSESSYLMVPVRIQDIPQFEPGVDLAIVVDTSAAIDDDALALSRATVDALLANLGEKDRAVVWAGDATLRNTVAGWDGLKQVTPEVRQQTSVALAKLRRGGATDLGTLLAEAASKLPLKRNGAVIYVGDGRPTVGELTLTELRTRLDKLARPVRIFGLGVGAQANMAVIDGLTRAGLAARIDDGSSAARAALQILESMQSPALLGLKLDLGPTVERIMPRDSSTVVANETLFVVGRLKGKAPNSIKVTTPAGERTLPLVIRNTNDEGDLQVRWANGRLRQLLEEGVGRSSLVDLGVRAGIITPFISLYVPTAREVTQAEREKLRGMQRIWRGESKSKKRFPSFGLLGCSKEKAASSEPAAVSQTSDDNVDRKVAAQPPAPVAASPQAKGAPAEPRAAGGKGARAAAAAAESDKAEREEGKPQDTFLDESVTGADRPVANEATRTKDSTAQPPPPPGQATGGLGLSGTGYGGGGVGEKQKKPDSALNAEKSRLQDEAKLLSLLAASGDGLKPELVGSVVPAVSVTLTVNALPHTIVACSAAANLPLLERVKLWRERLRKSVGLPAAVAQVYWSAARNCELTSHLDRAHMHILMLDALPTIPTQVALLHQFGVTSATSEALYRRILARVKTAVQMRELHAALGLKAMDPGALAQQVAKAKDASQLVQLLRSLRVQWPDDFTLALSLLDALEDAGDDEGARLLAFELRGRPDADAHLRTQVGELFLRLGARSKNEAQSKEDLAEARRTFGEIVEEAPEDPVARRLLGDLLRAHGWYAEAARQYETLAALSPDDPTVWLLRASAAQGLGKLDEALRLAEKALGQGASGSSDGLSVSARVLSGTFLAWGRDQSRRDNRTKDYEVLGIKQRKLMSQEDRKDGQTRVVLSWSHPAFRPTLWTHALGSPMPASGGDLSLGLMQAIVPSTGTTIEVRVDEKDLVRFARLGAKATLTVVFDEGKESEKVVTMPVAFERGGKSKLSFVLRGQEVVQ